MIDRVLSGGQTGVDRAALDAALEAGLACGGWCPKGRRAEDGPISVRYPLTETASKAYRVRTEQNVRAGDATIVLFRGRPRGGTKLTATFAREFGKPFLLLDLSVGPDPAAAAAWCEERGVRSLNVAGPRESQAPGIYAEATPFLLALLRASRRGAFLATWRHDTGGEPDGAEAALCAADEGLGRVIRAVVEASGPQRFGPPRAPTHFEAVARSILYQQLSGKAAAAIYGRVLGALGGELSPRSVAGALTEALRAAGLSGPKARYLRALADAVLGGLDLEALAGLPDAAVVAELTRVQGVGVWTAQMFLMFQLGRLDVLPSADLGIRKGLQLAHGLPAPAAPRHVERAGERWAPYRSIACLYLWGAVELGLLSASPAGAV